MDEFDDRKIMHLLPVSFAEYVGVDCQRDSRRLLGSGFEERVDEIGTVLACGQNQGGPEPTRRSACDW